MKLYFAVRYLTLFRRLEPKMTASENVSEYLCLDVRLGVG